jgi:hypothetical protein
MKQPHRVAWIIILIVDASYALWGAMAAALPDLLPGTHGVPILPAGYEGFTGSSWSELASASPLTAGYMEILFRVYGAHCLAFALMGCTIAATAFRRGEAWAWWALLVGNTIAFASAMTYDWLANAIGPFELSEYLGLVLLYGSLLVTAPFLAARRPLPRTAH